MNQKLAKGISYLMHPLFIPTYLFSYLLFFSDLLVISEKTKGVIFLVVFFFTCVLPLLSMTSLYLFRYIDNFHLPTSRERRIPFMLISFVYALGTFFINWIHDRLLFDPKVIFIIFSITLSIYLLSIVTFFWKISAHALALGGTLGIFLVFAYKTNDIAVALPILIVSALLGMTMTSRLSLNAHTIKEVWIGALVGILINVLFVFVFWI